MSHCEISGSMSCDECGQTFCEACMGSDILGQTLCLSCATSIPTKHGDFIKEGEITLYAVMSDMGLYTIGDELDFELENLADARHDFPDMEFWVQTFKMPAQSNRLDN